MLSVVAVVRCSVVSLLLLKILASAGATLLSPTVRIFSSLAASPTRPQRFASTVATPPPVSSSESPPFSLSERFIVVWVGWTESDVVDVVISSRIVVVVVASPPSSPRSAASSEPLPDNRRYVACLDSSWEGCVCEDSVLKRPEGIKIEVIKKT